MNYADFEKIWASSSSISCHTSGSTGIPKIIQLSKEFMLESARRTNNYFGIDSGSYLYSCISPDFIGGKMMYVRAVLAGCRFGFETPSNHPFSKCKECQTIDLVSIVPSQLEFLMHNPRYLENVGALLVGSSSIHPDLAKLVADNKVDAYESYGMTETASHIALRKITGENEPFEPLPGILLSSEEGCLVININNHDIIKTNDLVEFVGNNKFFIKGRKDNIIISGGLKISPEEIEEVLKPLIPRPFIVSSLPDEKWGQRMILIIESDYAAASSANQSDIIYLRNGLYPCEEVLNDKIYSYLKDKLPAYKHPKNIYYTSSLPLTPTGKLRRNIADSLSLS